MRTLLTAVLFVSSISTSAFATSADCIDAIKTALSLSSDQEVEFGKGRSDSGLECSASFHYFEFSKGANQGLRTLNISESSQIPYPDGTLSAMGPVKLYTLADSNGLEDFIVKSCTVSADHISVQYRKVQKSGWHSKFNHAIDLEFKNGKVSRMNTCNF